jgi:hypothetical protein
MKITSFLNNKLSFILVQAIPLFLIACATPPKPQTLSKPETSYSSYTPENMERLKTDIEGCKGTAQYYVGDQKGEFEVVTLISADEILLDSDSGENRSDDKYKSNEPNERVDAEETLPKPSKPKEILSSSGDDEYSEDDEYISDEPVDVGKDLLKIAKIFVGVGFAALGAVAGNAVGKALNDAGGEALNRSLTAFGASAGVSTMIDASDGNTTWGDAGPGTYGRDSRIVLKVVSSWESAAIEKTKTCLSKLGYSVLFSE